MDKKILRTLAVLTVGFGLNALTTDNAAAEMTERRVPVDTNYRQSGAPLSGIPFRVYVGPHAALKTITVPYNTSWTGIEPREMLETKFIPNNYIGPY